MNEGLEAYKPIVGPGEIRDILQLAGYLHGRRLQHINSTYTGGGVAEILSRVVPLMQEIGLDVHWTVIDGNPEFFDITKAFHNALHGQPIDLTPRMLEAFREVTHSNADKLDRDANIVILHDPQPVGLAEFRDGFQGRLIWRCHIDVSRADPSVWRFLQGFVSRCDAAIYHLVDFSRNLPINEYIVPPAIDAFSEKNCELPQEEIDEVLERFGIDASRPIVAQVSRFDRLKDPVGVIEGYRLTRRHQDCQLVLAGGGAPDDPEGQKVLQEVLEAKGDDPDIFVIDLPPDSHRVINALQRAADIAVQKSTREGFGLVVAEAMWKGKPVIGGNVGGIRRQIIHGVTGYRVNTVEGLSWRLRELLGDPEKARRMGKLAKEQVRQNFLLPQYLKNWLMVFLSLEHPHGNLVDLTKG
jgi:trehalose synthase